MPSNQDAARTATPRVTTHVEVSSCVQRLVIVSDLHAYREPLKALDTIVDQLDEPYVVLVNGDIFEGGIDGRFAVAWTMRHATGRTTRGNHDSGIFGYLDARPSLGEGAPDDTELGAYHTMAPDQLEFVKSLPDVLDVRWRGCSLRLMHGHFNLRTSESTNWRHTPAELSELFADPAVDLTVIGHTHFPFICRGAAGALANPGSVAAPLFRYRDHAGRDIDRRADDPSLAVDDSRPSFLTVTEQNGQLQPRIDRFDYNRTALLKRHADRLDLQMPIEVRHAWIMEGRAPELRRSSSHSRGM